ncbi:MAG: hypothetical protein ABFE01_10655, partial [Phycisphaerales bacterium]
MTLREILSGTSNWFRSHRYAPAGHCEPSLDGDGLLTMPLDSEDGFGDATTGHKQGGSMKSGVVALERREPIEKLQEGFNRLIGQLEQINEHLNEQVAQHQELMGKVRQLPQVLESLPSAVETQKRLTAQLLDRLQSTAAKDQQFLEVVGRIPTETARQTETLVSIDHQLAAAADTDVQMTQS